MGLPTGQSDEDIFSNDVPSCQMTLAFVKLKETNQYTRSPLPFPTFLESDVADLTATKCDRESLICLCLPQREVAFLQMVQEALSHVRNISLESLMVPTPVGHFKGTDSSWGGDNILCGLCSPTQ